MVYHTINQSTSQPLALRFRLARESSQQLKKALAETEAAHFVRGPVATFVEGWEVG